MRQRSTIKDPVTGRMEKVYYSGEKPRRGFFTNDKYFKEINLSPAMAHEKVVSLVYLLDEYYEEKKMKKNPQPTLEDNFWEEA